LSNVSTTIYFQML